MRVPQPPNGRVRHASGNTSTFSVPPRSTTESLARTSMRAPARDRRRLEMLCRYIARLPVSTQRLSRLDDRRLLYRLKRRWRDGTTHVVFEPIAPPPD